MVVAFVVVVVVVLMAPLHARAHGGRERANLSRREVFTSLGVKAGPKNESVSVKFDAERRRRTQTLTCCLRRLLLLLRVMRLNFRGRHTRLDESV
jgi:hypothetical protein